MSVSTKSVKTTYISRLIDCYLNRLSDCQDEFEQYLKEMMEYQKVQEIDEFDDYSGETLDTDKLENSCDKLKDIIETLSNDFTTWISSIKSHRPSNIWSLEKARKWKHEIINQIDYIEQNIDEKSLEIKPKIKRFKELMLESKRQLIYLSDLLELAAEFRMTKLGKFRSWAIGFGGFLLGVFVEKIVDFIIGAL